LAGGPTPPFAFPTIAYPYLVFYRWDEEKDEVTILRVRHAARRGDWRKGR
jgi:plasmid stabilization system protein ParE